MNTQIQEFQFNSLQLTAIADENGEILFIAKEVSEILGYSAAEAMTRRLDEDEKLMRQIVVSGQNRDVLLVNESGLYSSIIGSTKPEAKTFKKWVTSEVLPSIRKNGFYFGQNSAFSQLQNLLNPKTEPLSLAEFEVFKNDLKNVTDLLIHESLKNIPVLLSASDLVARNTKPREKLERIGGSHETRPKRWTQADYDKIRELREQDYTVQQIADAIGRTKVATQFRISMMIRGEV